MEKTFRDLYFRPHPNGRTGVQAIINFDNGYGASVVQTDTSYGYRDGLYEIAVLGKDGHISYSTPITSDVIGYLTEEEVSEILIQIQKL